MLKRSKTSLFISSTCYDLGQVRVDLQEFIENIGFNPVLSDFDTFPVNPSEDTLESCLEAIRSHTDIFVLIIGGRYGSLTSNGKSITNLEFEEARIQGIPIYVFIQDNILPHIPVWKKNPDADFSMVVDTPKLFEFISSLRDSGTIWTFPFKNAQEIKSKLKNQLSYLFAESLSLRKKFYENNYVLSNLRPKALRLAVEKEDNWEMLLFAQVLKDQTEQYSDKRLDVELCISFGEPVILEEYQETMNWISGRFPWVLHIMNHLNSIMNNGFKKAVGKPGQPGDLKKIIHLATRLGEGYEQLLDWKLQFFRVDAPAEFHSLLALAPEIVSNAIDELEEFAFNLYDQIESVCSDDNLEDGAIVEMTLKLTASGDREFTAELRRVAKRLGIEY